MGSLLLESGCGSAAGGGAGEGRRGGRGTLDAEEEAAAPPPAPFFQQQKRALAAMMRIAKVVLFSVYMLLYGSYLFEYVVCSVLYIFQDKLLSILEYASLKFLKSRYFLI